MRNALNIILDVLNESFGIIIVDDDDFAINDYISDSITFIQFIIALEKKIQLTLPDDFLVVDILNSAKGFAEKLSSFLETSTAELK